MAKIVAPENVQIAAMQEKKVQAMSNAMTPGRGTPWEDRGAQGLLAGFFKSAFAVMFKPVGLLWQIRRPETTRETTWFVVGCSMFWAISIGIHGTWLYYSTYLHNPKFKFTVDAKVYLFDTCLLAVAMLFATLCGWRLAAYFFYRITSFDMAGKIPKVLVTNVLGYTFAPSILAIIPFAGPPLAITWVVVLWAVAGVGRLRLKLAASIIGMVLTALATAVIVVGTLYGLMQLWDKALDYGPFTATAPLVSH